MNIGIDVGVLIAPNIPGIAPDIPVVVNGSSAINPGADSAYWKFEFQETPLTYYSYKNWTSLVIEPRNHLVLVYVKGETSIPAQQVNLSLTLYLEIRPAS